MTYKNIVMKKTPKVKQSRPLRGAFGKGTSLTLQAYYYLVWELIRRDPEYISLYRKQAYDEIDAIFSTNLKCCVNKNVCKPIHSYSEIVRKGHFLEPTALIEALPRPCLLKPKDINDEKKNGSNTEFSVGEINAKATLSQISFCLAQTIESSKYENKEKIFKDCVKSVKKQGMFKKRQKPFDLIQYHQEFNIFNLVNKEKMAFVEKNSDIQKRTEIEKIIKEHDYIRFYPDTTSENYDNIIREMFNNVRTKKSLQKLFHNSIGSAHKPQLEMCLKVQPSPEEEINNFYNLYGGKIEDFIVKYCRKWAKELIQNGVRSKDQEFRNNFSRIMSDGLEDLFMLMGNTQYKKPYAFQVCPDEEHIIAVKSVNGTSVYAFTIVGIEQEIEEKNLPFFAHFIKLDNEKHGEFQMKSTRPQKI